MSGLKLSISSATIHGALPYKWLRPTSPPAPCRSHSPLPVPNLTSSCTRIIPIPTRPSLPAAARGPILPAARPQGPYTATDSKGLRFSSHPFLRRPRPGHRCLPSYSSSDNRGEFVGSGNMVSENAKSEALLKNHDDTNRKASAAAAHRDSSPPSMQDDDQKPSKLLTLPTILTLGRVAAVPLLVSTFYLDSRWATAATTSIFIAAAITDWLDGYLARRMRLGSAFGAFLDPVADKLMVAATLVLLCTRPVEFHIVGQFPWLMTVPAIAIIGREITMSAVREWAASQNTKLLEAVAVNNLGKWKTATQMTALTILLATRDSSIGGPGLVGTGIGLLYMSAGLAVWSLVVYMKKIWKVLLK